MPISHFLEDPETGNRARISAEGQVAVGPGSFSDPFFNEMATTAAFNYVGPKAGKRFVVTGFVVSANNGVDVGGSTVNIYEAASATEATVAKQLFRVIIGRQDSLPVPDQNLIVTEGVWINGTRSGGGTVALTVLGYFVDKKAFVGT